MIKCLKSYDKTRTYVKAPLEEFCILLVTGNIGLNILLSLD